MLLHPVELHLRRHTTYSTIAKIVRLRRLNLTFAGVSRVNKFRLFFVYAFYSWGLFRLSYRLSPWITTFTAFALLFVSIEDVIKLRWILPCRLDAMHLLLQGWQHAVRPSHQNLLL